MRKRIEGIGCYLSCMMLFNLIYVFLILSKSIPYLKYINKMDLFMNLSVLITLFISSGLVIIGFLFTIYNIKLDDTERNDAATGKSFEVVTVHDKTAENYLTNFSVLVLTSLSLSPYPDWFMFLVYILIETSIGIVYVKKKLYYMNPILTLLNYSVYECTGKNSSNGRMFDGVYIFIVKDICIEEKQTIKYKNINSKIIWLKNR